MPIKHQRIHRNRKFGTHNHRFVWNIGCCEEACPDMAGVEGFVLWDRQERKPVMTFHDDYHQAFCMETTRPNGYPFTLAENWFNSLTNDELKSENITPTK